MRLGAILNQVNGAIVSSHAYRYDGLNRRTEASLEDGSMWKYDYNDRDELIGARRYWPDWSPVSGQLFAYDYDNIGSRKTASAGGVCRQFQVCSLERPSPAASQTGAGFLQTPRASQERVPPEAPLRSLAAARLHLLAKAICGKLAL